MLVPALPQTVMPAVLDLHVRAAALCNADPHMCGLLCPAVLNPAFLLLLLQWGGRFGDPNKYNPDRFLPGAAEETGRHPNAFK